MGDGTTTATARCAQCGCVLYLIAGTWSDNNRVATSGHAFDMDRICPAPGHFTHQPKPSTTEGGSR